MVGLASLGQPAEKQVLPLSQLPHLPPPAFLGDFAHVYGPLRPMKKRRLFAPVD